MKDRLLTEEFIQIFKNELKNSNKTYEPSISSKIEVFVNEQVFIGIFERLNFLV